MHPRSTSSVLCSTFATAPKDATRHRQEPESAPAGIPGPCPGSYEPIASKFFVTTSIVSFSSAVGLNSTISVFGKDHPHPWDVLQSSGVYGRPSEVKLEVLGGRGLLRRPAF